MAKHVHIHDHRKDGVGAALKKALDAYSKVQADYKMQAPDPARCCGTCSMFRGAAPVGSCTIVDGNIFTAGTCKYWAMPKVLDRAGKFGLMRDGVWRLVDMDGDDWGTWNASSLEDAIRQLRADVARRPGAYMGRPNEESIRKALRMAGADAGPDQVAHKGYLIIVNKIQNEVYIKKDGHNIGTAKTVEEAKKIIDEHLTGDAASDRFDQLVRQLLTEKKTRADLEAALQREKATFEEKTAALALFERLSKTKDAADKQFSNKSAFEAEVKRIAAGASWHTTGVRAPGAEQLVLYVVGNKSVGQWDNNRNVGWITSDSDEGADPAEMQQLHDLAARFKKEGKTRTDLDRELAKHPRLTQTQRGAVIAQFNAGGTFGQA